MSIHSTFLHRMDVISWSIFRFQLTKKDLSIRSSHLVCWESSTHQKTWAEISPLPGRSLETLDDALLQLISVLQGKRPSYLFPSVSFALTTGLKQLYFPPIPICAFLSGSKEEIYAQAFLAKQKGFSSAKIKISQLSLNDAFDVLETLRKVFFLRVDANQSLGFKDAMNFFRQFPTDAFDFIEEPTWEIHRLASFPHPFGLDETIERKPDFIFEHLVNCKAVIVKPMIQGISAIKNLIKRLKKRKVKLIFSSSYESGLGLMQIASLATQMTKELLVKELYPLGLDTQSLFIEDILTPFPIFSTPICTCSFQPKIQTHLLQKVCGG